MNENQPAINHNREPVLSALAHLIEVVAQLRNPDGGCPWDLAQTQQTLIPSTSYSSSTDGQSVVY